MRICYLDLFSGVSGDMLMGALVDAGVNPSEIIRALDSLNLDAKYSFVPVSKNGIRGTKFVVESSDHNPHRRLSQIVRLIEQSTVPESPRKRAIAVFERLGEVESQIHQIPPERVHFHEVGAVDSIADIVGVCLGFECLQVDQIWSSPVNLGTGTIECAHGRLPVPAPATAALLLGTPVYTTDVRGELTTPTGAALLTILADGFSALPRMKISSIGYGAGEMDLPRQANLLRLCVGETYASLN
jgi:uncharacterized protein (TIGR00299 family) protein